MQNKTRHPQVKEAKEQSWVVGEVKEPPSPPPRPRPNPKPVDEDLYRISPELLYAKAKKVCDVISYSTSNNYIVIYPLFAATCFFLPLPVCPT